MEIGYWKLVAKHLSGNASPEEETALKAWIREDSGNEVMFHRLQKLWDLSGGEKLLTNPSTDEEWKDLKARMDHKEPAMRTLQFSYQNLLRMAASLLLIASIGFLIIYTTSTVLLPEDDPAIQPAIQLVSVQARDVRELYLPDGSKVWLNAGSKLSYAHQFSGEQRKVFLTGEAFFSVTRDTLRPFQVFAGKTRTEVLGTSFHVKAGIADQQVEVTVVTGSVSFGPDTGKEEVVLSPEEKGTYHLGSSTLGKGAYNNAGFLAWIPKETKGEEAHPMSYLKSNSSWKKNAIGLTVLGGKLKNISDHTTYINIDLKATLYIAKKNKQLSKKFTIKGPLKPGETYDYRKLVLKDWFSRTSHVSVKILDAETKHNKPKQR